MDHVVEIEGTEIDNMEGTLDDRILELFDSWGNNAFSEQFGDVAITKSSKHSDQRHGKTNDKIRAYPAIPSVIQNGVVIDSIQKDVSGLERIVVAAPVTVGDPAEKMYVAVMLQRDPQSQRLYLHDVVTEKEFSNNSGEHLITHRGSDAVDEELYTTDILRIALNVKDDVSQSGFEIKEQNQFRDSVSENGLEDLRKERSDLEERIDMAYFNDVSDAEIRKMENRLVKVNHEIDKIAEKVKSR